MTAGRDGAKIHNRGTISAKAYYIVHQGEYIVGIYIVLIFKKLKLECNRSTVLLVSAAQQCASAVCVRTSSPS